jgi:hypothetical protein
MIKIDKNDIYETGDLEIGEGYTASIRCEYDDTHSAPWEEYDGHGVVSGWERRDKRPGELILCEDRGSRRFYDFQESVKIARRDGWDCAPYGQGTVGERAHRAAMVDYKYLRGWCNNDWYYVVVCVELYYNGKAVADDCLGGIESLGDYWKECAAEMINEAIHAHQKELQESAHWAQRDVVTV